MAAFRFNFVTSTEVTNPMQETHVEVDTNDGNNHKKNVGSDEVVPAFDVYPSVEQMLLKEMELNTGSFNFGPDVINYICSSSLQKHLQEETGNQSLLASDQNHSDLVPGVYEGGLKIWECALVLADFLFKNNCIAPNITVLELGCGAGIPGLWAYFCGANVIFQDFNPEVLKMVTIPNVILNTPIDKRHSIAEKCTFRAGDWEAVRRKYYTSDSTNELLCDVILTSETIYEKQNHKKLLELMKCALKPNGIIYLAAKIHYFGVGGGIDDFEKLVKDDKTFETKVCSEIQEGLEKKIIQLTFLKAT